MGHHVVHPAPGRNGFHIIRVDGDIRVVGGPMERYVAVSECDDESTTHGQIHHPRQVCWHNLGRVIKSPFITRAACLHLAGLRKGVDQVGVRGREQSIGGNRSRINLGQLDHSSLPIREIRPIGGPPALGVHIIKPAKVALSLLPQPTTFHRTPCTLNHGVLPAGGNIEDPCPLKDADLAVAVTSPSYQFVAAGSGTGTALVRSLHGQDVAPPNGEFLHGVEPGGRIALAITGIAPDHHGSVFQNGGGVKAAGGNLGHKTRLGGVTFGGSIVSEIRGPLKRHILGAQRLRDYRQGLTHVGCRRKRGGTSFLAGGDHGGSRCQKGHRRSGDPRHVGVGTLVTDGQPAAGRGRQCESSAIHHLRGQGSKRNRLGGTHVEGLGLGGSHHVIFESREVGLARGNHRLSCTHQSDRGPAHRGHVGVGRSKGDGGTTGGLDGSESEGRVPHGLDR